MDNENTTYTMTESEKSFIDGLVKSMRKEVFEYLLEVVKEKAGLKVDDCLRNAYHSDIIYKRRNTADLKDFVKDSVDEL